MAEVEPASRPRALPGRRHREARDAWLRQCTGTEHAATVAYLSAYPLQEIPRGQRESSAGMSAACWRTRPPGSMTSSGCLPAGGAW